MMPLEFFQSYHVGPQVYLEEMGEEDWKIWINDSLFCEGQPKNKAHRAANREFKERIMTYQI